MRRCKCVHLRDGVARIGDVRTLLLGQKGTHMPSVTALTVLREICCFCSACSPSKEHCHPTGAFIAVTLSTCLSVSTHEIDRDLLNWVSSTVSLWVLNYILSTRSNFIWTRTKILDKFSNERKISHSSVFFKVIKNCLARRRIEDWSLLCFDPVSTCNITTYETWIFSSTALRSSKLEEEFLITAYIWQRDSYFIRRARLTISPGFCVWPLKYC
jgi:hypothetical protein